jgi:hypothetical protein
MEADEVTIDKNPSREFRLVGLFGVEGKLNLVGVAGTRAATDPAGRFSQASRWFVE